MNRTSFGDNELTEPSPPVKSNGDYLVDEGVEAPKPRFATVEMCMLTLAAGGLLHAGAAHKIQGKSFHNLFLRASEKRSRREILIWHHGRYSPSITVPGTLRWSKRNQTKAGFWSRRTFRSCMRLPSLGGWLKLFRGGLVPEAFFDSLH